jgi:hypothetical protein
MAYHVPQIVRLRVPAQIAQAVVCRITVCMAAEPALGGWTDKSLKHQSVDASSLLAPVDVERDHGITASADSGAEYLATRGSHAALVGHFETLKPNDGLPTLIFWHYHHLAAALVAGSRKPRVRPVFDGVKEVV